MAEECTPPDEPWQIVGEEGHAIAGISGRGRVAEAAAKEAAAAKATTGKFGSEPQATPTTPAQQKIAKAKADAMAKAQKR